jgi:hypothetical protein
MMSKQNINFIEPTEELYKEYKDKYPLFFWNYRPRKTRIERLIENYRIHTSSWSSAEICYYTSGAE